MASPGSGCSVWRVRAPSGHHTLRGEPSRGQVRSVVVLGQVGPFRRPNSECPSPSPRRATRSTQARRTHLRAGPHRWPGESRKPNTLALRPSRRPATTAATLVGAELCASAGGRGGSQRPQSLRALAEPNGPALGLVSLAARIRSASGRQTGDGPERQVHAAPREMGGRFPSGGVQQRCTSGAPGGRSTRQSSRRAAREACNRLPPPSA